MKVYLVWCDFDVLGVYATQAMAADYIKRELDEIEAKLGFRPSADFRIDERLIIEELGL